MNQKTAVSPDKKDAAHPASGLLQHVAVLSVPERSIPFASLTSSDFGHDFSQVTTRTMPSANGSTHSVSCPLSPRTCPFGGACHTCPVTVQAKSRVGRSGDQREQEADRIADLVTRTPGTFSEQGLGHSDPGKRGSPGKALGEGPEVDDQEKPPPRQGAATIQCDGSGGYEIVYNSWDKATCGTKSCVTAHENSHIDDWKAKWPTGCKGQPKGYLPKGDPPDKPLMTVAEYNAFLKKSECRAHTIDLSCAQALPQKGACKKTVEDYIKLTRRQRAQWCPSLASGAAAAVGAGVGAFAAGTAAAIGAAIAGQAF